MQNMFNGIVCKISSVVLYRELEFALAVVARICGITSASAARNVLYALRQNGVTTKTLSCIVMLVYPSLMDLLE